MLSTRKIEDKPLTNRNIEAMVGLSHETMVAGAAGARRRIEANASSDKSVEPDAWDEMIFEYRNKDYGAYILRKGYSHNLIIGLGLTIAVVVFILVYPTLSKFFGGEETVAKTPPRKLVYTELSAPPPIDKPKPPPPNIVIPRLQKIIKFVPPKVVKEDITELPPTIAEVKVAEIGAAEVEGPATVVFDEPVEEVITGDDEIFIAVDQQPEFPGGYEAMMAFVKQNMRYPANARKMKIEGTVHVSFVVSKTGEISDVKVLRGIMTTCDQEAVRVVQLMPPWKAGKQNGRNVNVRFILPLKFRLN